MIRNRYLFSIGEVNYFSLFRGRSWQTDSCKAFSLIEILMVIALMVLMGGLVFSFLKPINKYKELRAAGNQVSDLVTFAKLQSATQGTMSAILFVPKQSDGKKYWEARVLKMKNDRSWIQERKTVSFPQNIEIEVVNPQVADHEMISSFLNDSENEDSESGYGVLCFDANGMLRGREGSSSSIELTSKIDSQKKAFRIIFNGSSPAPKIILP